MSEGPMPIDPARELWLLWRRGPRPDVRRLLDRAGDLARRRSRRRCASTSESAGGSAIASRRPTTSATGPRCGAIPRRPSR